MRNYSAIQKLILLLSIVFGFSACASYEELVNFNKGTAFPATPVDISNATALRIQPDDILYIQVFADNLELAAPYNLVPQGGGQGNANRDALQLQGYLVDPQGMIDMAGLGRLQLAGLTIEEAKNKISTDLKNFLKEPVVNIRLLNFRINVLGEVAQPGTFPVTNERFTILEAIAQAGDLTPYANREDILIIRERNGKREFGHIDIRSTDMFQSPYFYLQQNDVVYVEPLETKTGIVRDPGTRILPWVSAVTSVTAFLLAIFNSSR